jgi:hypothetical protein
MRRAVFAALVLLAAPLAPAWAQPGWPPGPARPDLKVKSNYGGPGLADPALKLSLHDREVVRAYFIEQHGRGKCPEGLTKKENVCLPAGQAKKRYLVGRPLSPAIVSGPIPIELANRVGAPPRGYRYTLIDGDFVKVSTDSQVVVDAIDSLVN